MAPTKSAKIKESQEQKEGTKGGSSADQNQITG